MNKNAQGSLLIQTVEKDFKYPYENKKSSMKDEMQNIKKSLPGMITCNINDFEH